MKFERDRYPLTLGLYVRPVEWRKIVFIHFSRSGNSSLSNGFNNTHYHPTTTRLPLPPHYPPTAARRLKLKTFCFKQTVWTSIFKMAAVPHTVWVNTKNWIYTQSRPNTNKLSIINTKTQIILFGWTFKIFLISIKYV